MKQKQLVVVVLVIAVIVGAVAFYVGRQSWQNPQSAFSAIPQGGAAPLQVSFSIPTIEGADYDGVYYTVVFGDGEAGGFPRTPPFVLLHTYVSPGIYSAAITKRTQCSSWECLGEITEIGTATITVK